MKIIMKILGILTFVLGIYLCGWGIFNQQIDENTTFGILFIIVGLILLICGRDQINEKQNQIESSHNLPKPYCINHADIESIAFCEICKKPLCADCANEIHGNYYCESCKEPFLKKLEHIPYKSRTIAVILCLLFGGLGLHKVYLGYSSGSAILIFHIFFLPTSILLTIPFMVYIPVTFILLIVGLADLINIASGKTQDVYGRDLI